MYRPPSQNFNHVKSIRSKFENNNAEKETTTTKQPKSGNSSTNSNLNSKLEEKLDTKQKLLLSRQVSDPVNKRNNIKRTPAFRVDFNKNMDNSNCFNRSSVVNRSSLFENKIKKFNNNNISDSSKENIPQPPIMLVKSKSSHDFQYVRNKFVNKCETNDNESKVLCKTNNTDLSLLYTEPIPKALRKISNNSNIHNQSTLKIGSDIRNELTDTLKNALKKPLPCGPAPKKPPRTFQHSCEVSNTTFSTPSPTRSLEKNRSFLHLALESDRNDSDHNQQKKKKKQSDPKYMLNKLELALRNNKLRSRKIVESSPTNSLNFKNKHDISTTTTSGDDDSDDSLLFRSKTSASELTTKPAAVSESDSNVNSPIEDVGMCLLGCINPVMSAGRSSELDMAGSSTFFVGDDDEPIYATPVILTGDKHRNATVTEERLTRNNRNSLYYMSTAVLNTDDKQPNRKHIFSDYEGTACDTKQFTPENSSLSSFSSDADSVPINNMDEPNNSGKIKNLINSFEHKHTVVSKRQNAGTSKQDEHIYDEVGNDNYHDAGGVATASRVEVLKNSLQKTLESSFSNVSSSDKDHRNKHTFGDKRSMSFHQGSSGGKVMDILTKFQTYKKLLPKYSEPTVTNKDTLFYCCLVIEKVSDCARIKFKYPEYAEIPANIEYLCFPERDSLSVDCTYSAQSYSLLLTNEKGERTFGYCRRVLPEGSARCLPLAYCILSKHRAPRFYRKILVELESRHGIRNKYRDELIAQFYNQKFPRPGESIRVNLAQVEPKIYQDNNNYYPKDQNKKTDNGSNFKSPPINTNADTSLSNCWDVCEDLNSFVCVNRTGEYGTINVSNKKYEHVYISDADAGTSPNFVVHNGDKMELVLTLHSDMRYEDGALKNLHKLPSDILLKIFSSLVLERRVILIGSVISELSSCVESLQTILYPFTWPHTFIPILPEFLWDIVESPTPVICGVLSPEVVEDHHIENGIVVSLDDNTVVIEEGDELKILSNSMQKLWRRSVALANKAAASVDYVHSMYLADAYLQVFILCLKEYKTYIADGVFQKEEFIKNAKTKGIKRFLKMFTETHMFQSFMESILLDPNGFATFDQKIEMYGSEESNTVLTKLLEWNP